MVDNFVQLTGFLGEDAKSIAKDGKNYAVLSLATQDSYAIQEGDKTTWKDKQVEWHDVFVFRPAAVKAACELKRGEKVTVSGSISYKLFRDEKGYNRKQAFIHGNFIERADFHNKERAALANMVTELAENLKASA